MKKALLIALLLVTISLAFSWDILRQAQFPTNFYTLDRVNSTFWTAGYVGGFAKSVDNGNTWTFLPNPAYDTVTPAYKDINDIDFYDEMHGVMASADGLVAVTTDGGITWAASIYTPTIFGTDDVNACVYLPDGKIWVAGWGGKIAYSPDNGATWTQQTSGITDQIYSISVNAAGVGFCAVNNGTPDQSKILVTSNYGNNWGILNLTVTGNPHLYKVRQYGSTVLLAGSLGYIGVSYDNGATWTHHINAGGTSTNMQDIVLDGTNGYAAGWNGVLLKTTDSWTNFTPVTNNFGLYFEGLEILTNGNIMAAGWNGAIALSADQGVTWTDKVANATDIYSAKAINTNTWYLAGDKGNIIKTTDAGQTFNRLYIPDNFDTYYACYFKNANEGFVTGKTTGKIFRTINGGTDWTTFTVPGVTTTQSYYEFSFVSDMIGYVVGSTNINAKTIDGGVTWTLLNGTGLGTSVLNCAYFKTENIGFAGANAGQLYITQNGGLAWTPIVVGNTTAKIMDIWFNNENQGVLVNSAGEIFYTSTGGLTAGSWTAATESCLDDMNGVWCDEFDVFWASGYSSDNTSTNMGNSWSLIKSVDNGATWTQEVFLPLTFNSTRFTGITGAAGKLVAYGKNNVIVAQVNTGVTPPTYATDLFISEYVEGSSYQKALEIFNGTGAPVDLANYSLKKQTNGAGAFGSELVLSGTLANNDVYVIVNSSTGGTNLAGQPYVDLATLSQVVNFNGNDAVALYHNGVQTDVVGIIDQVDNWGIDITLVRNSNILSPTTTFNFADWTQYPINTFTDLGTHTFTPSGDPVAVAPTFNPPAGLYSSPISVTLSSTTPGAIIYYTTNGDIPTTSSTVYTAPIPVSSMTTIKAMAAANGYLNSSVATALYTFPVTVTNIAALRALPADNMTIYTLSGEVIVTFIQSYRNQKWLQDNTAGIMIDDFTGTVTTIYNVGDGITGLSGKMTEYGGMLEFVPSVNPGPASSTGNIITPEVITLSQLSANFEAYESEVVMVMGCSFVNPTGNFENGTVYPVNDGTDYNIRTSFYDVDYIGQPVPTIPMNIAGIANSRNDGNYLTPRNAADIQTPAGNVAAPTFSPIGGTYYEAIDLSISTTTTGASIYYTTNGTIPNMSSTLYTGMFDVNSTQTVKAIAYLGADSSAVSSATYTFPVEVNNLAALRQQTTGSTIYKVVGEIILTFQQAYRHQKWLQDSSAGILIDDFNGIITNVYNVGDGIAGVCGTLNEYGGMIQFVPTINPPIPGSMGNVIIPETVTISEFNANFEDYESELIQVFPVTFDTADSIFANGTVYPLSFLTQTMNFRTSFYDVDYIGTTIPTGYITVIGIPNSRTDGNYITSRSLADLVPGIIEAPYGLNFTIQNGNDVLLSWAPGDIVLPDRTERNWENLTALKVYRNDIVIATITDFILYEPAYYMDSDLPNGDYDYYVTNVYFNQYESAPSNTVSVNITANDDHVIIPAEKTALTGNYPNPFNPETTIGYSIKNPSKVNITIYNLKGEKVRTLVNESKGNGMYNVKWNGKDDNGRAVTSGVYLYRMQAGNFVSTKRMMLMK